DKQIVLLKEVFPAEMLLDIRRALVRWGRETPAVGIDDFRGNYHRERAMVSHLQKWPHVFHDYNFNDFSKLDAEFRAKVFSIFEPLRVLYNELTPNDIKFELPESGAWIHPQFIHYPVGGGFFARHWHNLLPQRLGFIVSMSKYGVDYPNGGTVFDIDGELVDVEGVHDMGDICLWRYDYHHWVKQSDLRDRFDWNSENGRWVATFPYYDPVPKA
ncbi:MAG TPA: hypothetical protein VJT82_08095, partial [Pyrinomonadaceae bacterium]|nr:hypothetical protein [Pyrinomonadaceae bacterium]